jgi:Caspase domain
MTRAICFGLNYTGSDYELPDCHLDAANMLRRSGASDFNGVEFTGIITADDFYAELIRLRENARKSHTSIITYSGHGTQWLEDAPDERDRQQEGLCFWNGREIEVFPDDEFRTILSQIQGTVFVVLDCCFSGGMSRNQKPPVETAKRKYLPFEPDFKIFRQEKSERAARPAAQNKIYFINASAESEVSWSTGKGGLFTLSFCKHFDKSARYGRTVKRIVELSAMDTKGEQTPNYHIVNGAANKRVF